MRLANVASKTRPVVVFAIVGAALSLGACGSSTTTEEPAPASPPPASTSAQSGGEQQAEAGEVCALAVRCCYGFVRVLTENRPEDRSTCVDLQDFPTGGPNAAHNCTEMLTGWQDAIAEAQRDVPECQ